MLSLMRILVITDTVPLQTTLLVFFSIYRQELFCMSFILWAMKFIFRCGQNDLILANSIISYDVSASSAVPV
jgi:hypothetical protein